MIFWCERWEGGKGAETGRETETQQRDQQDGRQTPGKTVGSRSRWSRGELWFPIQSDVADGSGGGSSFAHAELFKSRTMAQIDWRERISVDSAVCHGKPCIKGTRIMVSIILDYLSAGETHASILEQYPGLADDDIQAVLGYAAWLAHEEEQQPLHTGTVE